MTELVGDVVELARAPGEERSPAGTWRSTSWRATRSSGRSVGRERSAFDEHLHPSLVHADAQRLRPGDLEHARQRRQVEPAEADHRGVRRRRAASPSATTDPGSPPTTWTRSSTGSGARTTRARKPGSGLGLAIVQRVADEHDGKATP